MEELCFRSYWWFINFFLFSFPRSLIVLAALRLQVMLGGSWSGVCSWWCLGFQDVWKTWKVMDMCVLTIFLKGLGQLSVYFFPLCVVPNVNHFTSISSTFSSPHCPSHALELFYFDPIWPTLLCVCHCGLETTLAWEQMPVPSEQVSHSHDMGLAPFTELASTERSYLWR